MLYENLDRNPIRSLNKSLWPVGLNHIPLPPDKLSVRGLENFIRLREQGYKFLTVVGSRNFTEYGERACRELISGLADYNICIVSGLAYGIDSIAHRTALDFGLPTVAFPGSSLEISEIYPSAHVELADQIVGGGGCLVSEFQSGQSGAPWMFPQRNRLMVGIADAVLIIEASEKSGTGITAHMAIEYDRNILVVPGSIFNHNSKMTNRLIRSGANLISSSQDILSELGFDKLDIEQTKNHPEKKLNTIEKSVLEFIQRGVVGRDEILKEMKIPISELNRALTRLEIEGLI
jgi:DNA processing protein